MKKAIRLYITGIVQGVFFRNFIKENAEKLNIKGFTRNLKDKRIEIFIEGNTNNINQMIELCKKGPEHSIIKDIQTTKEKYQGFKEFKILHI